MGRNSVKGPVFYYARVRYGPTAHASLYRLCSVHSCTQYCVFYLPDSFLLPLNSLCTPASGKDVGFLVPLEEVLSKQQKTQTCTSSEVVVTKPVASFASHPDGGSVARSQLGHNPVSRSTLFIGKSSADLPAR